MTKKFHLAQTEVSHITTHYQVWRLEIVMDSLNLRKESLHKAVNYFRSKNFGVVFKHGKVDLDQSDVQLIADKIDKSVRLLGGHILIRYLIDKSTGGPGLYCAQGYLSKLSHNPPEEILEPLVPVNYLLNLAVKHLDDCLISPPSQRALLNQVIEDSKQFAVLYDVQPYDWVNRNQLQQMSLEQRLRELVLFDKLFMVEDMNPADVASIIKALMSDVEKKVMKQHSLEWTVEEAALFTDALLSRWNNPVGPHLIEESALCKTLTSLSPSTIDKLLDIFCHDRHTYSFALFESEHVDS